ncbi:MAG: glycosyltransferase [Patescibacteria group bacterium]
MSISIVIATYNSSRTIKRCLQSISAQIYPQNKIEIIVADGGSTDDTLEIARQFGAKIISVDPHKQNAEYNKSIGIQEARNEILLMLDHDNVLPHSRWLTNLVQPLLAHQDVIGVETLRYHYDPTTTILDRYFALFGAGDPLVWYLGRADRLSYIYDHYTLAGTATDYGSYYLVRFSPDFIPTVGANGFLVRRKILMKYAQAAPGKYFDIDVNADLIRNGFNTYAFVKDSVLHLTGYGNVWNFLKRRMLFLSQYRFGGKGLALKKVRRYGGLSSKDFLRLAWAVLVCLTFVIPLYHSFCGWRKIHDKAWFLHPILCFGFVVIYSWVIIRHQFRVYVQKILG